MKVDSSSHASSSMPRPSRSAAGAVSDTTAHQHPCLPAKLTAMVGARSSDDGLDFGLRIEAADLTCIEDIDIYIELLQHRATLVLTSRIMRLATFSFCRAYALADRNFTTSCKPSTSDA